MATEPSCEYALYFRLIFFLMQVKSLPWNEDTIAAETSLIQENLVFLNSKGILTINSQPHVNGAPSTDSTHGWGGSGGYIYQKVSKQNTTTNSSPTIFTVSPCYHKIAMHHCISIVKLCINERTALNRYSKTINNKNQCTQHYSRSYRQHDTLCLLYCTSSLFYYTPFHFPTN